MAQEYFVTNETLQRKVAEILPSQGGAGAGFDSDVGPVEVSGWIELGCDA